jgi:hypothetical protein
VKGEAAVRAAGAASAAGIGVVLAGVGVYAARTARQVLRR